MTDECKGDYGDGGDEVAWVDDCELARAMKERSVSRLS